MAAGIEWKADWIEPKQRKAFKEPPLMLWDLFTPQKDFFNGYERLRPPKELKFLFYTGKIKKAKVFASAHGVYEMWINGKRASDSLLTPETTNYEKLIWYQTIDVTGLVKEGKNELRIFLGDGWWIGRLGLSGESCNYGDKLGFIGQIEITDDKGHIDVIPVDDTCLSRTSFISYSDLYIGEKWDLTKVPGKWSRCIKADYPKDILRPQPIPGIKVTETVQVKEYLITPKGELVLDFGQVLAGVCSLTVSMAPSAADPESLEERTELNEKKKIILEHSEVLDKDGNFMMNIIGRYKNQTDVFIFDDRKEKYNLCPKFTYHGFRYVKVTGLLREEILDASALVIGTPLKKTGFFETDNELLNKLQSAIERSTVSNMVSIPTDCPQREKLGWTGDITAFAQTGCFLYDLKDFLGSWLLQLRLEQKEDGEVPVVAPNHPSQHRLQALMNGGSDSSAGWSDACVLVSLAMYKAYGDIKILKENFKTMEKWLQYIENTDWGSRFHFGDWLIPSLREKPDGVMLGAAATREIMAWSYYAITLEAMSEVCKALENEHLPNEKSQKCVNAADLVNEQEQASREVFDHETFAKETFIHESFTQETFVKAKDSLYYKEKLSEVRKRIVKDFVSDDGRVGDGTLQGQYVLALRSGALDGNPELKEKALKKLVELIMDTDYCIDTGFASVPYLLDILYDNGFKAIAYKMLFNEKQPGWLYMVKHGATSIWENWNAIHEDGTPTDSSFNHYAYGCVGSFMYRRIAGIQCLEPGYRKVRIAPDFDCGVGSCRCSLETPHGSIKVFWDKDCFEVSAPDTIDCIVVDR